MKAKKDNKVYQVDESSKKRYLDEGYDIYDDEGELLEHSPKKKITYAEHIKEIESLKQEIESLKQEIDSTKKESGKQASKGEKRVTVEEEEK